MSSVTLSNASALWSLSLFFVSAKRDDDSNLYFTEQNVGEMKMPGQKYVLSNE